MGEDFDIDQLSPQLFSARQSWKMTEPEKVIAIIRDAGVWRLGNCDGCMCSRFSIRNVDIDINCGKGSPRGVTISSPSMDYTEGGAELRLIGEEVARQVQESDGRSPPITVTVEERRCR